MDKRSKEVQFSGHETFVLKQLWLRKAVNFSRNAISNGSKPSFSGIDAMVDLGVGKNMLSSMKWWAVQSGFLDNKESLRPTQLADLIFGKNECDSGIDPYCQSPSLPWLVHWNLASIPSRFTAFWFCFNELAPGSYDREFLYAGLTEFAKKYLPNISDRTIKNDMDIFFRSYAPDCSYRKKDDVEEQVDSLLSSTGIVTVASKDLISISSAKRSSLPTELFVWALLQMWERLDEQNPSNSLNWQDIAYKSGSPGRVFKLSEADLNSRLESVEDLTDKKLVWVDQLGVKNLVRKKQNPQLFSELKEEMLKRSFLKE